ncbi:ABATE domain-containing protein [Paraburkholderia sp. BL10I2N1]|uniref:CGNR zinc finger domain-containing protein n=1 Tax=Paraburkholderia sp. BL10I2N1 TaxID=1938796 RepID=UPI00105B7AEA|nr:ABATE domain-containing protein [Paraburkholderia sp. BL10I2N1]TDN61223.1 putative RNA-binding Zn ribbon-like protein [Paraburkholderia sp. BL10I2N1]
MVTARKTDKSFLVPGPSETLSLDFANTRYWRGEDEPTESLSTLDDVLAWCEQSGAIPLELISVFREAYASDESAAGNAFSSACALRETLYRLLLVSAKGGGAAARDVAALKAFFARAASRSELVMADGRFMWAIGHGRVDIERLLSPVLWSAADLLGGPRLARLKCCANGRCRWLFIDDSKSANRRWCSMSSCGNRAKAHRHYHSKRET